MTIRIISLLLLSIFGAQIHGQSLEAGYGQSGVMIYLKGNLNMSGRLEIRRTDQSAEGRIWTLHPARTVEEFLNNASGMPIVFKGLLPVTEKTAAFYVDKLNNATSIESIPLSNTPNILFSLGLAVCDTTVRSGQSYQYQLFVDGSAVDAGVTVTTSLNVDSDWKPTFYSGTNDERIIRCRWFIPYEKKQQVYTYVAYKSPPFEPKFEAITGIPGFIASGDSILAVFMDTASIHNPGVFHYRIQPIDRFGKKGPISEYGEGSNFTPTSEPVMVYFKASGSQDQPAIRLNWKVINAWRIQSMALYRSRAYQGPFEMIGHFSAQDSSYLDPVTDVMESYFYYFEMDDLAQDTPVRTATVTSRSEYKIPASIPDSVTVKPIGRSIQISWRRTGYQDRGYYVLRSEGYGEPTDIISSFIQVTDDQRYTWIDTSSLLKADKYYSYAVISESIGYERSAPSEVVSARPDVPVYIPAPSQLDISRQNDTSFLLSWEDLFAQETNNHLGYRVFQKDPKAKEGHRLLTPEMLLFESNYLLLHHITPEDEFFVRAYNIFGDESADSKSVSFNDPFFYKFGPEYLMGKNESTGIRLRWNRPLRSDIARYKLFRVGADNKMTELATVKAEQTEYTDTKVKPGVTYYYIITAECRNGLASDASEVLPVTR